MNPLIETLAFACRRSPSEHPLLQYGDQRHFFGGVIDHIVCLHKVSPCVEGLARGRGGQRRPYAHS